MLSIHFIDSSFLQPVYSSICFHHMHTPFEAVILVVLSFMQTVVPILRAGIMFS